jgi:hypothetical protein
MSDTGDVPQEISRTEHRSGSPPLPGRPLSTGEQAPGSEGGTRDSGHDMGPGGSGVRSWPRRLLRWIPVAAAILSILGLASLSYARPARTFCGSCHTVAEASEASAASVHAGVSCLSCHHRSGVIGVATYFPTLIRETIHQTTGLPVAGNILEPRPCETCHQQIADSEGHRTLPGGCLECHGDVAHPETTGREDPPHPQDYFRTHGRDAVRQWASCTECHQTTFCRACHAGAAFPHPATWISEHGAIAVESNAAACSTCHPTSYCAGCHGSEVPHPPNWLGRHNVTDPDSVPGCTTCHAQDECQVCHVQHGVHRQQSLYDLESAG